MVSNDSSLLISFARESLYNIIMINGSNGTVPAYLDHKTALCVWCGINLLICIFGTLMTFVLFLVVCKDRVLTGSSILIAHVILIGFAMCSVLLPINTLVTCLAPYFQPRQLDCVLIHFSMVLVTDAGFWSETLLAFNRLIAIIFPDHYNYWTRRKSVALAITLCWLISASVNLPYCFGHGGIAQVTPPWYNCNLRTDNPAHYSMTQFFAIYIPLILCGICYAIIFVSIALRGRKNQEIQPANFLSARERNARKVTALAYQRRISMTRTVFASAVWCCLCYFPYSIVVSLFYDVYIAFPVLELYLRTIFLIGYAANPVGILLQASEQTSSCLTATCATFVLELSKKN